MATKRAFSKKGGWSAHNPARYRSGLEETVASHLEAIGIDPQFEQFAVSYVIPASNHTYHPDFVLPNGIIIETKGIFDADDRKKHVLLRTQHPELDIRFVFSSSRTKIYKGSPTSYAQWCSKNGFKFADKSIPPEWLEESMKDTSALRHKTNNKKE